MDRVNDPSATAQRQFTDGDDLAGIEGTIVPATWLNGMQEELVGGLVEASGQTPSATDNTQVTRAVQLIGRRVTEFLTPGVTSWTVPPDVYRIWVKVYGAGGGSGGSYNNASASIGGGGGGFDEGPFDVVPGTVFPITVGAGGAGGIATNPPTAGAAGGASSFGSLISATGGQGGAGNSNIAAGVAIAVGGQGVGGINPRTGASSDGPFPVSSGGAVFTSRGGRSGGDGGEGGHSGATSSSALGVPGSVPGGGAAGSAAQANGGPGASGMVRVEY